MKRIVLSGIACAAMCAPAFAQSTATGQTSSTPAPAGQSRAQTITMSGCVANASGGAQGFMLTNPIVLPGNTGASSSATPGGSITSGATTQPPASAVGTSGTAATGASHPVTGAAAGTAGTSGTAGTAATGSAASATPPATGAAAGAASSTFNGYRLSGNDMTQWAGKRVEVTGAFAPSATANSAAASTGSNAATLQEFRVVSVKPVGGSCPQN